MRLEWSEPGEGWTGGDWAEHAGLCELLRGLAFHPQVGASEDPEQSFCVTGLKYSQAPSGGFGGNRLGHQGGSWAGGRN